MQPPCPLWGLKRTFRSAIARSAKSQKRTCTELTDKTDCGVDNAITAPENTALLNIRVFQVGDVLWDTADYESSVKRRLR